MYGDRTCSVDDYSYCKFSTVRLIRYTALPPTFFIGAFAITKVAQPLPFLLNEREYLERGGVNVMAFQDIYPQVHQSGVSVIRHGVRDATGGDLRQLLRVDDVR